VIELKISVFLTFIPTKMRLYCISISLQLILVNIFQNLIISANFHQNYRINSSQITNQPKFEARQSRPVLTSSPGLPNSDLTSGTIFNDQFATAILRFVILCNMNIIHNYLHFYLALAMKL